MEQENSTEALVPQSGEQAEVVASPEDAEASYRNPDFDVVDSDSGAADAEAQEPAAEPSGAGEAAEKPAQSREENAAIRAARLRAQRDARREAEAEARAAADAEIAASGVVNPYTQKPFGSMEELKAYGARVKNAARAKEAKATGRSIEQLDEDEANRAFLTQMRQQAERQAAEAQQRAQAAAAARAFVDRDVMEFIQRHPEVGAKGLSELENNPQFRQFCGSRFGREPLSGLYEDFMGLVGSAGSAAVAREKSRGARSTGSGTTGAAVLTPAQKKALDEWNANNPEMAMTAKEFLGR